MVKETASLTRNLNGSSKISSFLYPRGKLRSLWNLCLCGNEKSLKLCFQDSKAVNYTSLILPNRRFSVAPHLTQVGDKDPPSKYGNTRSCSYGFSSAACAGFSQFPDMFEAWNGRAKTIRTDRAVTWKKSRRLRASKTLKMHACRSEHERPGCKMLDVLACWEIVGKCHDIPTATSLRAGSTIFNSDYRVLKGCCCHWLLQGKLEVLVLLSLLTSLRYYLLLIYPPVN